MQSLVITQDQAKDLSKILHIFHESLMMLIREGSLKVDNVSITWTDDIVRVIIAEPIPKDHSKED